MSRRELGGEVDAGAVPQPAGWCHDVSGCELRNLGALHEEKTQDADVLVGLL